MNLNIRALELKKVPKYVGETLWLDVCRNVLDAIKIMPVILAQAFGDL